MVFQSERTIHLQFCQSHYISHYTVSTSTWESTRVHPVVCALTLHLFIVSSTTVQLQWRCSHAPLLLLPTGLANSEGVASSLTVVLCRNCYTVLPLLLARGRERVCRTIVPYCPSEPLHSWFLSGQLLQLRRGRGGQTQSCRCPILNVFLFLEE